MHCAVMPAQLGLRGEIGVVVAASQAPGFPGQTDRLLLNVAANQAAIALHEERLLSEQKRLARDLDDRVAQRTHELAEANQALKREIAERLISEEALGKLRSELAHMARVTSLGALTASIAHEINQPLSGIITNASTSLLMLAADPPNIAGARETGRRIIRDGNRAADVVARLRALFSKKPAATDTVDLNDATREVIALLSSDLQRSHVIVRAEFGGARLLVTGDRVQLQQVILNLVRNAAEAMSEVDDGQRYLSIETRTEDDQWARLSVKDVGVGFAPQSAERLFDAFYTTKSSGMGIGLSVSRSIIDSHGGRLWAEANDGPGVTFSFSIPRQTGGAGDGRIPDRGTARPSR
jgi:C4-dicarboxylate-specific signal transduction histidine kinase